MSDGREELDAAAAGDAVEPVDDRRAYVLERTSSEVHLLLDNLSASPDWTISNLTMGHSGASLEDDWLDRVCRITWPPDATEAGTKRQAEQAALLIRVKDYLNSLAKPASGATIAFTLMVTQDEDPVSEGASAQQGQSGRSHSRSSLAREAYPDLRQKARDFRRWMRMMGLVFALVLAGTCLLSWYAAFGNAALADLAAAEKAVRDAELRVDGAGLVVVDAVDKAHPVRVRCMAQRSAAAPAVPAGGQGQGQAREGGAALNVVEVCAALNEARMVRHQARVGLDTWASFWGNATTARWTLTTLGTAVLPVLYGFIGAAAAIVRSLSRKMKASLLSPRDRQLSLQQLALGAVVGACIGLFIAGPAEKGGTDISLLGPVALSSSAISFVAGFGVEAVFNALEALIARIFNVAPPPIAAAPQIVPVVAELPGGIAKPAAGAPRRPQGAVDQADSRLP